MMNSSRTLSSSVVENATAIPWCWWNCNYERNHNNRNGTDGTASVDMNVVLETGGGPPTHRGSDGQVYCDTKNDMVYIWDGDTWLAAAVGSTGTASTCTREADPEDDDLLDDDDFGLPAGDAKVKDNNYWPINREPP